jgi:hypothetical protein
MVWATVLPMPEFDTTLALESLVYRQQRNRAVSLSDRKRRMGL